MKKIFGIALKTIILAFALFAVNGLAQTPGGLDTTFGTNGKVATHLDTTATLKDVVVQPDGKVVFVGTTFGGNMSLTGFVARLNPNGTFDTTFAGDGVINNFFMRDPNSVALQPDGKILVGGISNDLRLSVVRFNTDGTLDMTFNGSGTVATVIGTNPFGGSVNLQADGKIVLAGTAVVSGTSDFALLRFNSDGTLDIAFGTGGRQATNINGNDFVYESTVQPDGKIVLSGYSTDALSTVKQATVVRYNADGSLDTTFGSGGKIVRASSSDSFADTVNIQPDGKVIISGYGIPILRYNSNGTFDTVFAASGAYPVEFAFRADGKIVFAGGEANNFALVRYNADGTLDSTFGTNGKILTAFNPENYFSIAAFAPDGKIVGGGTRLSNNFEIVLARYYGDSATRRTQMDFDGDGKADVSVFRPETGVWYIRQSSGGVTGVAFGLGTDKLVPADYDGDGKTDIAVFRNGTWHLQQTAAGYTGLVFGAATDKPIPNAFVRGNYGD